MFGDQVGEIGDVLREGAEKREEVALVVEEWRRRKGRRWEEARGLLKLGRR